MACFFYHSFIYLKILHTACQRYVQREEALRARFIDSLEFDHFQIIQSFWEYRGSFAHQFICYLLIH